MNGLVALQAFLTEETYGGAILISPINLQDLQGPLEWHL